MVQCLSLICLALIAAPQKKADDLAKLKVMAKQVLAKAYSASDAEPPKELFGSQEPVVRNTEPGKTVLLMYREGSVAFSLADSIPVYFSCTLKPQPLDVPLTGRQVRDRVSAFSRAFMPGKSFELEVRRQGRLNVRVMEQGVAHFDGFWLDVDKDTGVITHGGFPPKLPAVTPRNVGRVEKEVAVGAALQAALVKNPELETFQVKQVRAYWMVPPKGLARNAPTHLLNAASQGRAIKAYLVGTYGEKLATGVKSRKNGAIWVDAETGKVISGDLVHINGASIAGVPNVGNVKHPDAVFVDHEWKRVSVGGLAAKEAADPKGAEVLAMEGSIVVRARFNSKEGVLWLPSAKKWHSVKISY